jgi:hypothetical protein
MPKRKLGHLFSKEFLANYLDTSVPVTEVEVTSSHAAHESGATTVVESTIVESVAVVTGVSVAELLQLETANIAAIATIAKIDFLICSCFIFVIYRIIIL